MPTPIILNHEQPWQCVVLSERILVNAYRLKYILCILALRQLQLLFLLDTLLYLLFDQFQLRCEQVTGVFICVVNVHD